MSEFGRQLRDAFAAEQRRIEPLGDTPRRLLDTALTRSAGRSLPLQLAAVAALVVVVTAVSGVLMLTRLHRTAVPAGSRPTAGATAAPTAPSSPAVKPTPVAQPFSLPDSVPAIAVGDAANRNQLDAVAWDGSGLGRLPFSGPAIPNPTATLFLTQAGIVDRRGHVVGSLALSRAKETVAWADDGRTLCRVTPELGPAAGVPANLQLASIAGAWRTVGRYGAVTDASSISVAACSVLNNRAVLVDNTLQGPNTRQFWVVELTTGRVISHRSYTADGSTVVSILPSGDGNLVAENRSACCPVSNGKVTVYGPSGAVIRTFDGVAGGLAGTALAWDGTRMVLAADAPEPQVSIVDVRSGATIWRAPVGLRVAGVIAEAAPGGRIAVELNAVGAVAGPDGYVPAADLYLPDSSSVAWRPSINVRPL